MLSMMLRVAAEMQKLLTMKKSGLSMLPARSLLSLDTRLKLEPTPNLLSISIKQLKVQVL